LHLLHVVQLEDANHTALNARQSLQQEAEMYLRRVVERFTRAPLANLSLTVSWSVIIDPDAAAAILEQRADHSYDLIAMASHGRSGFQLWALGSVTERVLQTSALPLLIVRSDSATTRPAAHGAEQPEADLEMSAWPGYEPTPTKTPTR
jgi:nucleotide-binding universal stress UspA family protein